MTAAPPVTSAATPSAAAPRLRVVGIGCDGWAGLPERSRGVLASAERIVGAPRQLALLADDPAAASALTAAFEQWPEKYWTRWGEVLGALDPAADVVLASGDPMFHGIGATLVRELGAEAIEVFPAPSSAALACARMGWALNETPVVTLVTGPAGREGTGAVVAAADRGIPFLVLCRSAESVGHVADALRESIVRRFAVVDDGSANGTGAGSGTGAAHGAGAGNGAGAANGNGTATGAGGGNGAPQGSVAHIAELLDATVLTAMTNLGGPADGAYAEDVRRGTVGKPPTAAGDLTVLAVEPAAPARAWLTDGDFETDGQLTKSPFREMTVAALGPAPGALLWDVGGGTGSIAIEWARHGGRAVCIERDSGRAERIESNVAALSGGVRVVRGDAPQALRVLLDGDRPVGDGGDRPDAIFIGGGLTAPGMVDVCLDALKPGGRLVANTVTIESEAIIWAARADLEARGLPIGDVRRIGVERAGKVGSFTAWRQALPVVQWTVDKAAADRVTVDKVREQHP